MNRRGPLAINLLIAICLLVLLWPLEGKIETQLTELRPERGKVAVGLELPGIYRFFEMAGLNSLLADLLWMKAHDMWYSASWWQMAPVMETIVRINPKFILVWQVLSWHYGWNLHAASPTAVERAQWLAKAEDAYERGVAANPDNVDLWWDMCWFYVDRTRQYDKAAEKLEAGLEKFPDELDTLARTLQRIYEKTWRVDDAIRVIKYIQSKRPEDGLARRDLEWWEKVGKDVNWRWVLEFREHLLRAGRDLPWYRNPFEGTLVSSPPWRDWEAPLYMKPDWKPDLSRFEIASLGLVFHSRPDLVKEYLEAHPELKPTPKPPQPQAQPAPPAAGGLTGPPLGIGPPPGGRPRIYREQPHEHEH
jgi:tetratricopeptide (TPR) repeat protein